MYHENSNWWEEESKDESTGSVAVTLSHPGSAAKSLSLKKMQTSYICTDVSVRDRIRDVTDSFKMIEHITWDSVSAWWLTCSSHRSD